MFKNARTIRAKKMCSEGRESNLHKTSWISKYFDGRPPKPALATLIPRAFENTSCIQNHGIVYFPTSTKLRFSLLTWKNSISKKWIINHFVWDYRKIRSSKSFQKYLSQCTMGWICEDINTFPMIRCTLRKSHMRRL